MNRHRCEIRRKHTGLPCILKIGAVFNGRTRWQKGANRESADRPPHKYLAPVLGTAPLALAACAPYFLPRPSHLVIENGGIVRQRR